MKAYIVVDMQNDFVDTDVLGSPQGAVAVTNAVSFLRDNLQDGDILVTTQDTHYEESYLHTQEGTKLPVPHCYVGTAGHDLAPELGDFANAMFMGLPDGEFHRDVDVYFTEKVVFGSSDSVEIVEKAILKHGKRVDEVVIMGIASDICVISTAALFKSSVLLKDIPIKVYKDGCAGITPELHEQALNVMKSFQVEVI